MLPKMTSIPPEILKQNVARLRKSASQGDVNAQFDLGFALHRGLGCTQDAKEAFKWFHMAAKKGHLEAQCNLGNAFANGTGCDRDIMQAIEWYRKAAMKGFVDAEFNLVTTFVFSNDNGEITKDLAEWWREASQKNFASSQFELGCLLKAGKGCKQDLNKAFVLFSNAAKQGHIEAQFNLAAALENGHGCEKDQKAAITWYRSAAKHHSEAKMKFAQLLLTTTKPPIVSVAQPVTDLSTAIHPVPTPSVVPSEQTSPSKEKKRDDPSPIVLSRQTGIEEASLEDDDWEKNFEKEKEEEKRKQDEEKSKTSKDKDKDKDEEKDEDDRDWDPFKNLKQGLTRFEVASRGGVESKSGLDKLSFTINGSEIYKKLTDPYINKTKLLKQFCESAHIGDSKFFFGRTKSLEQLGKDLIKKFHENTAFEKILYATLRASRLSIGRKRGGLTHMGTYTAINVALLEASINGKSFFLMSLSKFKEENHVKLRQALQSLCDDFTKAGTSIFLLPETYSDAGKLINQVLSIIGFAPAKIQDGQICPERAQLEFMFLFYLHFKNKMNVQWKGSLNLKLFLFFDNKPNYCQPSETTDQHDRLYLTKNSYCLTTTNCKNCIQHQGELMAFAMIGQECAQKINLPQSFSFAPTLEKFFELCQTHTSLTPVSSASIIVADEKNKTESDWDPFDIKETQLRSTVGDIFPDFFSAFKKSEVFKNIKNPSVNKSALLKKFSPYIHCGDSEYLFDTSEYLKNFARDFIKEYKDNEALIEATCTEDRLIETGKSYKVECFTPKCISFLELKINGTTVIFVGLSQDGNDDTKLRQQIQSHCDSLTKKGIPTFFLPLQSNTTNRLIIKMAETMGFPVAKKPFKQCTEKKLLELVLRFYLGKINAALVWGGVLLASFWIFNNKERNMLESRRGARIYLPDENCWISTLPSCEHCQANHPATLALMMAVKECAPHIAKMHREYSSFCDSKLDTFLKSHLRQTCDPAQVNVAKSSIFKVGNATPVRDAGIPPQEEVSLQGPSQVIRV